MSPDTAQLLVGRRDGRISIVAGAGGRLVQELNAHKAPVTALCFSRDGATFVSCSNDASIRFWRRNGEGESAVWSPGPVAHVGVDVVGAAMSSDGTLLVTTQRRTSLAAWSVPDARPLGTIATDAWRPAISPDGRWVCVGLWDWSIQLWGSRSFSSTQDGPVASRHPVTSLVGHAQLVTDEAFDPAGGVLATVSDDGKVKLWDVSPPAEVQSDAVTAAVVEPQRCLATLDGRAGEANAIAFLPAPLQHQVAVGYRDGSVQVWDLQRFDANIAGHLEFQRSLRRPPDAGL
jgi:WD40 repeat protein